MFVKDVIQCPVPSLLQSEDEGCLNWNLKLIMLLLRRETWLKRPGIVINYPILTTEVKLGAPLDM